VKRKLASTVKIVSGLKLVPQMTWT